MRNKSGLIDPYKEMRMP